MPTFEPKTKTDFAFRIASWNILVMTPLTRKAKAFVKKHVTAEPWQIMNDGILCEPRQGIDLCNALRGHGFALEWS